MAANGPRYRRLAGRDSPTKRTNPKPRKNHFDGANPAVRVHAVLGGSYGLGLAEALMIVSELRSYSMSARL
jgi:hypothetical protein